LVVGQVAATDLMLQYPKFRLRSGLQFVDDDGLIIQPILTTDFISVMPIKKNAFIINLPDRQRLTTSVPQNLFREQTEFVSGQWLN
jgi:hypothetical protein